MIGLVMEDISVKLVTNKLQITQITKEFHLSSTVKRVLPLKIMKFNLGNESTVGAQPLLFLRKRNIHFFFAPIIV